MKLSWFMFFKDVIVLVAGTKAGSNARLELHRQELEYRSFRLSMRSSTPSICECRTVGVVCCSDVFVKMDGVVTWEIIVHNGKICVKVELLQWRIEYERTN